MSTKGQGVSIDEVMARFSPKRRARIEAHAKELIAEEMSLRALRRAMGKTQAAMAVTLGIKQENVSRLEQRSDMLLSTLNDYLKPLGGKLRLVAEFKDRPPVLLSGFKDLDAEPPALPKRASPRSRSAAATPATAIQRGRRKEVETAASTSSHEVRVD